MAERRGDTSLEELDVMIELLRLWVLLMERVVMGKWVVVKR